MKAARFAICLMSIVWGLGFSYSASAEVISPQNAEVIRHEKGAAIQLFVQKSSHPNAAASVAVLSLPAGGQVPEHRDPEDEFIYFLEGEGQMWIDDKPFPIKAGDVAYLPKNAKVKFQAGSKAVKVIQVFAPAGVEKKYQAWKKSPAAKKTSNP